MNRQRGWTHPPRHIVFQLWSKSLRAVERLFVQFISRRRCYFKRSTTSIRLLKDSVFTADPVRTWCRILPSLASSVLNHSIQPTFCWKFQHTITVLTTNCSTRRLKTAWIEATDRIRQSAKSRQNIRSQCPIKWTWIQLVFAWRKPSSVQSCKFSTQRATATTATFTPHLSSASRITFSSGRSCCWRETLRCRLCGFLFIFSLPSASDWFSKEWETRRRTWGTTSTLSSILSCSWCSQRSPVSKPHVSWPWVLWATLVDVYWFF